MLVSFVWRDMALLDDWRAHSCQVFAAVAGGQNIVVCLELTREVIWKILLQCDLYPH